jgi:3-hydroxyacyl-CoA dehydrogenase
MPTPEQVAKLRAAVRDVIDQNIAAGYRPKRFMNMTANGDVDDIVEVCESLLTSAEAFEKVEAAARKFPAPPTLEDKVAETPDGFGLSRVAVEQARARVAYLDSIIKGRRGRA